MDVGTLAANPMIGWTVMAIGALAVLYTVIQRMWKPMRRFVAMMDVVLGRPPRYDGDPEARPGLVQRLDGIDGSICRLDRRVTRIERHVTSDDEGNDYAR